MGLIILSNGLRHGKSPMLSQVRIDIVSMPYLRTSNSSKLKGIAHGVRRS